VQVSGHSRRRSGDTDGCLIQIAKLTNNGQMVYSTFVIEHAVELEMSNGETIIITAPRAIVVTGHNVPTTWNGIDIDSLVPGDSNDREYSDYLNAQYAFQVAEQDAPDTPCVDAAPSEASLSDLNRHAKASVTAMKAVDGAHREISTIIYVEPGSGSVRKIMMQTSNQQNFVISDFSLIPSGVIVIGAAHTHPHEDDEDRRFPSEADQEFFARMEDWFEDNQYDTTVSFNPVMYIYDAEHDQTFVYDRYKVSGNVLPCTL
jgi:hypothetical protein